MARLLVIEGLIGVGKTTLCRILAREWGARLVLEPADDNPFLANFYEDPQRFAFPAQMFYLAMRYQQQQELRQGDLFAPLVVADYLFAKDRLFAEMTLRGNEMALYHRFAGLLPDPPPRPDLVVFLDADTEVIRSRIARRGLSHEQVIPARYLDELRERYLSLWAGYTEAPIRFLRTDDIDYANDPAQRASLLKMLEGWMDGAAAPPTQGLFGSGPA